MTLLYSAALQCSLAPHHPPVRFVPTKIISSTSSSSNLTRRRALSTALISTTLSTLIFSVSPSKSAITEFLELPNSGGVKALDLRLGAGEVPSDGDQILTVRLGFSNDSDRLLLLVVAIHYYGRLAAKQGWRFDSTYDHKDENGEPVPYVFVIGKVISGIETAVKSMKVGGLRRIVIPPSQGYQSTSQEPLPPNFFDRQRLFTTIFNPTHLANGEGSTLGTLVFDIELVSLRHK